jgi:hypothetical protein
MTEQSILNDDLIERFGTIVRTSGSVKTAIMVTGINPERYDTWVRKVRDGGGSSVVRRFLTAVDRKLGEFKLLRERRLVQHTENEWRAGAWVLERRFPDEYGLRPGPATEAPPEHPRPERIVWIEAKPNKPKKNP